MSALLPLLLEFMCLVEWMDQALRLEDQIMKNRKQSMRVLKYEKCKVWLSVLMMPIILTACADRRFDTSQSISLVLSPIIQYESQFLNTVADEAEGGYCPAHVELGKDYKLTRDKIRIAKKELKK